MARRSATATIAPPWWGAGEAPEARWPGVVMAIPCLWSEDGERWESPDGRFYFDADAADFAEQFFPTCLQHHIGNEWNGTPFTLMPYQAVLVRALFGWKRAADGYRRFRKVFLAVPKGNGKSPLCAGLGLLLAFFDGEAGAEAYAVAADRKQAGIVHESGKVMVTRNADWERLKLFEVYRDSIKRSGSTECFQVLSSDASTKHGFRPHAILFDEFHAQPDRDLFDTLYRGMGKRTQPVLVMITTAGDDDESICAEEWDYARRVIRGEIADPVYLPMVFEAQPDEDWSQEAVWRRVNPGYGITMKADYFETECQAARAEPRKRNSFLQLHLNRWVNQATAWIPVEWWDACDRPLPSDAELQTLPVTAGLDMAQKIDLTCFALTFRRRIDAGQTIEAVDGQTEERKTLNLNYEVIVLPFFWIPEATMREHEEHDGVPYSQWVNAGLVRVTEGVSIDYTRIVRDITTEIVPRFPRLREAVIGYDPAFASDTVSDLRKFAGRDEWCVEVLQNYQHMSEPCYTFEALVKAGRVLHGGHRALRNHIANVEVKQDDALRIRPVKPKRRSKHIDGVVASLMGLKMLATIEDAPSEPQLFFLGGRHGRPHA